uniref:ZM domain-containing protein n=1 Tax=Gongylonema pulchrum TaxID=637853 RepID=A0A183ERF2_9BILA
LGQAIVQHIYGTRASQHSYAHTPTIPLTANGILPNAYVNAAEKQLHGTLHQRHNAELTDFKPQMQAQKVVRVPVAQPLPETSKPQQADGDPTMQGMQYERITLLQTSSVAPTTNNKFKNIPYKRYVLRPSEYHRYINGMPDQLVGQNMPLISHTALNLPRTTFKFPNDAEIIRNSGFSHFEKTPPPLSHTDSNLLAQLHNREVYLHKQRQQLNPQLPDLPAQPLQQPRMSIGENSQRASTTQGLFFAKLSFFSYFKKEWRGKADRRTSSFENIRTSSVTEFLLLRHRKEALKSGFS